MYEKLTKYLELITDDNKMGNWIIDKNHTGTEDEPMVMPYVQYSNLVHDFLHDFYDLGIADKNYFENTRSYRELIDDTDNYINFTEQQLISTLTYFIRGDRFCEGLLLNKFQDGTIEAILKQLSKFDNKENSEYE